MNTSVPSGLRNVEDGVFFVVPTLNPEKTIGTGKSIIEEVN